MTKCDKSSRTGVKMDLQWFWSCRLIINGAFHPKFNCEISFQLTFTKPGWILFIRSSEPSINKPCWVSGVTSCCSCQLICETDLLIWRTQDRLYLNNLIEVIRLKSQTASTFNIQILFLSFTFKGVKETRAPRQTPQHINNSSITYQ